MNLHGEGAEVLSEAVLSVLDWRDADGEVLFGDMDKSVAVEAVVNVLQSGNALSLESIWTECIEVAAARAGIPSGYIYAEFNYMCSDVYVTKEAASLPEWKDKSEAFTKLTGFEPIEGA
jgi:hypothetical protein